MLSFQTRLRVLLSNFGTDGGWAIERDGVIVGTMRRIYRDGAPTYLYKLETSDDKLAQADVHTRDDLADLAIDELTEITGQTAEEAKALIMKAREHWFTA